ncbi:MAG TPA: NADH-quinone oxidoreductase subunit C [Candidatus Dormibacteraeota bacterium]
MSSKARGFAERADDPAGADQGPGNHTQTVISDTLIVEKGVSAGDAWISVEASNVHDALSSLRDGGYRLLVFLTCVDHLADASGEWPGRYELVYQLRNLESREQIRVRAFVDGDPPHVASVHDLFPPANWDERETYDMFGVVFDGHPELTRILMPDDWVGHPLRRDYPVGGEVVEFSEEHETWQTAPEKA